MKQIIIGSTAAQKYSLSRRNPSDLDIWCDEEISLRKGLDVKIIPRHIIDLVEVDSGGCATPNSLFTIKCSHLGWDNPMWNKHYLDVLFMKQKGCVIQEPLFAKLIHYWKDELGDKSFLSLKQGKEDFFTDHVNYTYDHDLLHEVASSPNRPMYEKCLREGESVLIDKDKFFRMEESEQILMFWEEIHVIAYERWVIPNGTPWMEQQDWEGKQLDKDIIVPNNKVYSPDTCVFANSRVNLLLISNGSRRGKYKQGVSLTGKKFRSDCNIGSGKQIYIGSFPTEQEAYQAYVDYKHALIVKVAHEQEDERVKNGLLLHAQILLDTLEDE